MPSFEPQCFEGYKFRLRPHGFWRTILSEIYRLRFLYLNGSYINFNLTIGIPRSVKELEPIEYEWELFDRTTRAVKTSGSGRILLSKKKRQLSNYFTDPIGGVTEKGEKLQPIITTGSGYYKAYLSLEKAVKVGYVVDDMKCYIKMKFHIGKREFIPDPMAVFNVIDKDDLQKIGIEYIVSTIIGIVVGFILGKFLR